MTRSAVLAATIFSALLGTEYLEAQVPMWGVALAAKVDSLAEATLEDGRVSGLSIGVMRGQDVLVVQGYGFANLDHQAPAGPHTVYNESIGPQPRRRSQHRGAIVFWQIR